VIDVGAGPGRFTIELARIGAFLTVVDISPTQLQLNEKRLAAAEVEGQVDERALADVLDLSRWPDGSFDAPIRSSDLHPGWRRRVELTYLAKPN
jgi:ubiquinone/menaquinone biosynthesis C-methylase UbiE